MGAEYGDPRLPERFWVKVYPEPNTGCWLWGAATYRNDYGAFSRSVDGKWRAQLAHRAAYLALVGPVEDGVELDHLCRVRWCVLPDHLEPVSHRENTLRGQAMTAVQARRTHCSENHEFTEDNTYWHRGHRSCLICRRANALAYYHKRNKAVS